MTRRKRATRVFVQHLQTCSTISTISYVADKKTDMIRVFECFSRVLSSAVSSKKSCPIFLYMHRINKITLFKLKMQIAVVNESKIREVLEKNSYHYTNIILFDFPSHYISPIIPRLLINFNFRSNAIVKNKRDTFHRIYIYIPSLNILRSANHSHNSIKIFLE